MSTRPIWTPESGRTQAAQWTAFLQFVNDKYGAGSGDCAALHDWSVGNPEAFWRSVWEFCEVIGEAGGVAFSDGSKMLGARWFPEARLNFAKNLLRLRDRSDALVSWGVDRVTRRISHAELYRDVARMSAALRAEGVGPGDCIAAFMPNLPEVVIAMLASASIGAIFSTCSPDFGVWVARTGFTARSTLCSVTMEPFSRYPSIYACCAIGSNEDRWNRSPAQGAGIAGVFVSRARI